MKLAAGILMPLMVIDIESNRGRTMTALEPNLYTFNSITFCSQPDVAWDVIFGTVVGLEDARLG